MSKKEQPICNSIIQHLSTECSRVKTSTLTYKNYNELIHSNEYGKNYVYLKAHYQSGDVCIYNQIGKFQLTKKPLMVLGAYDHNRSIKKEGPISTQIDDIVLFETNRKLNYKERIIEAVLY